ncbi:low molecular weight protein-tyrosine-phosphatase [Winogradskyella costae]|uniref:low molecular weight protein-tyrosine-phosphatase n=1 Tax=Winogradskyella costae TaxID=2697008 RepID=UPI0015CC5F9C|nr:low molecular weight protein-tyrosine-phosphatase [Winogradskyella costae]
MTRILMVCLGNICRSPLAHGILQSKVSAEHYYVDSAGTAAYHIGNAPDRRSIAVAKHNGLDISAQSARQFKTSDFDAFDYIYAMDESNYSDIISLVRHTGDIEKVNLFLETNPSIQNKNVPDPYYGNEGGFEYVFDLITETCDLLVKKLGK